MRKFFFFLFFVVIHFFAGAQPGNLDATFNPGTGANDAVHSMIQQPDDKILIGGIFTSYNGTARTRIARLNTDGSLDDTFNPGSGANDFVLSMARQPDGKILIAGFFTNYNGTARNRIARLNSDGSLDASFNPGSGADNVIYSIGLQSDGKILIGGIFTTYNGTTRNRIARLNTDGSLDATFDPGSGAEQVVYPIVVQPDGKIIIGGKFTTYNGTARNRIARLNANGSLDASFNPGSGANDYVYAVDLQPDGKILIGGVFTTYNGTGKNHIARLNADGSLDATFNSGSGTDEGVFYVIRQSDGKILIGGDFSSYNGIGRNLLARLNADGSLDPSFDPGTGPNNLGVYSMIQQSDGKLLIGGVFTTYNGTNINRIARINNGSTSMISTSALLTASLCAGSTISVPFTATGSFATGNTFTAQLSDATGSFVAPVVIGTLSGTASGTITATIPTTAAAGTGYRIRVISSNPAITGTDNGSNLQIIKIGITGVETHVSCNGGSNGSIDLTPSGGTTPYTYNWGSGITTQDRTGLSAGAYSVTITDAIGCTAARSFTITQPAAVSATAVVTPISCNGGNNGAIDLTPSGGTPPYTYNWGGGITTQDRVNLAAGSYSVTITDANGCTGTVSATVSQPAALAVTPASQTNVSCNGGSNGAANVNTPTGGTGPYTYNWTPGNPTGDGTASVTGLTAGTWTCTVTDANGCAASQSFNIIAVGTIPDVTATPVSQTVCSGAAISTIGLASTTSGTTYSWTRDNTTSVMGIAASGTGDISGVLTNTTGAAITVSFTIIPTANGCNGVPVIATVIVPPSLVATANSQTNVACNGGSNGSATVSVTGGTGAYTYSWAPSGGSAATATGLAAGDYTVTVTDANSCSTTQLFTITQPAAVAIHSVTVPVNGTYTSGDNLDFTVNYSHNVIVNTTGGTPSMTLTLNTGGKRQASYLSGSGTSSLVFRHTLNATDQDADGISVGSNIVLNGGTITNSTGCDALSALNGLPPTTGILVHNPVVQTITFGALPVKTYGDADFDINATTTSGLPLTYTSSNTAVATIVADKIHIVGAGTAIITAAQMGDFNYLPASAVSQTLTVNPKAVTVTADAKTKTYGDADPALTYVVSPALISGDAFTGVLSRVAGENVNSYAINQHTLALNGNYTLTYISASLTIDKKPVTVTADAQTKTYGDPDPVLSYHVTGLVGADLLSGNLDRTPGTDAGVYPINLGTLTAGTNYSITYNGADVTIVPKAVTVTAIVQSKIYGDADPALSYTVSPALIGSDAFSGALSRVAGEEVGDYAIHQNSLALSGNYVLNYTGAGLTITKKAVTVAAEAKSKTYGDADPVLTYTVSPALVSGDAFTGNLSRAAGEGVGNYAINQNTLALNGNYAITYTGATLSIGQKMVTVTAEAKSKIYGDTDPALTYTVTPALVSGDAFTGALSRVAGEDVGLYTIHQNTLALNNNYELNYTDANFTIGKKAITVTAAAKTKTYGMADPAFTYSVLPALVNGDVLTGALSRTAGENVGNYPINQGSLNHNNYSISFVSSELTIGKASQQITWNQTLVSGCDGNTNLVLTATASSGLPVSYQSGNAGIATITNNQLVIAGPGTTNITASQPGNNNYLPAADVQHELTSKLPAHLLVKRWDDVLVFDNSSQQYTAWQWYKNGVAINGATGQYYHEATKLNGEYYVVVQTATGLTMQTCPLTITPGGTFIPITIFPNPVAPGQSITVKTGYTAAQLQGATIIVSNINGAVVQTIQNVAPETNIVMPLFQGMYVIRLKLSNGVTASVNALVKPQ